jgi:hypothetical protein
VKTLSDTKPLATFSNSPSAIRALFCHAFPAESGYILRMSETEQQVLQTLLQLEQAAATMATANPKPDLLPIFARLDELARQLPPSADPMLLHYLHRKSYEKARLLLQNPAAR